MAKNTQETKHVHIDEDKYKALDSSIIIPDNGHEDGPDLTNIDPKLIEAALRVANQPLPQYTIKLPSEQKARDAIRARLM